MRTVTLDVSLLGRDYKVSCKESERAELHRRRRVPRSRMREIRDARQDAGAERIAVMAALNIAHDCSARTRAPPPHRARLAPSRTRD